MSPFRGSLLPTEGSILCPLLTCCRSPCPKYVRTTGRILLSNSSKCFVLFSFSEVVKRVKRSHSTCFCRVSIGHIGHIGHLRLNIDPGISRVALLSPFVFSICYRMFSICVASLASLKNSAASFLSVFSFSEGVKWSHGTCFYRVPEHCSHWSPEAEHSSNISSVAEGTRTFLMDRFLGMEWQGWYLGTRFPAICRKSPGFRLPAGRIGYQCVLKLSTTTVHHTQPQMSF